MKKLNQKTVIKIGVSVILTAVTVLALYGFGWGMSAEKNVLLSLASLPENQKWEISGNFLLDGKQLESPITMEFGGQVTFAISDPKMDSRWNLSGEPFGEVNLFNLAYNGADWMLEVPTISREEIWKMPTDASTLTKDTILRWVKELEFQKIGYMPLEREYGGSISCLHVRSSANILPKKMIDWLANVADKDLTAERREELQNTIKDNLKLSVDCFITPDMKLMEIIIATSLEGGFTAEIVMAGRPEKGEMPDFAYYDTKNKVEVNADMLEEFLSTLENFKSGVDQ